MGAQTGPQQHRHSHQQQQWQAEEEGVWVVQRRLTVVVTQRPFLPHRLSLARPLLLLLLPLAPTHSGTRRTALRRARAAATSRQLQQQRQVQEQQLLLRQERPCQRVRRHQRAPWPKHWMQ